jgi:GT2 family glycosyltransferase
LLTEYPWVKHIQGPSRGPAANRNNGARAATGEWLVFCDDDCLPDRKLLSSYSAAQAAYPDCAVFEGRTMADREKRHPLEESPINSKGGNLWSCNFAIRRKLFEKMGGFDETFPYAAVEDMEFRVRLEKAGVRMVFLENAVVVHPWRKLSVAGYLAQHARHRKSHLLMRSLHPDYRSYFTAWNVVKDIARYYVKNFAGDLRAFGGSALLFQPLYLWCQLRRMGAYKFGRC